MKRLIVLILLIFFISTAFAESSGIDSWQKNNDWKRANGYDFPFYGETAADLTPISDYLTLLSDNGIYLTLPDLSVTKHDDYDWIYTKISDSFYLTYVYWFEDQRDSLSLEVPMNYRPKDNALPILIMSMMGVDREEADRLYESLQYNVIDGSSEIKVDGFILDYFEIGDQSRGTQSLTVKRDNAP